jgi:hypothetical protein
MTSTKKGISADAFSSVSDIKPLTVTIAMSRKISGLGNTKIWELIKNRKLETIRIGRRRLVTVRSLEALLTPSPPGRLGTGGGNG